MQKSSIRSKTLANFGKGFLNKSLPSYLILFVNNICQLRCDMCFYWDSMQVKTTQLTLEEIENVVEIFKKSSCPFELMHCNSTYPMPDDEANLLCIKSNFILLN